MGLSPKQIVAGWRNDRIGTRLVHESDAMRVWHLRLAPGETLPPHRHDRPYLWTILTDGQGLSRFDDGRELPITYHSGDTGDFPDLSPDNGFVHDLTNVGESELVFVTIEFNQIG